MSKNPVNNVSYSNITQFIEPITVSNSSVIIKNKNLKLNEELDSSKVQADLEYILNFHKSHQVKELSILDTINIETIKDDVDTILGINEYTLKYNLNNTEAIQSLTKFLKIPFSNFFKDNEIEFNIDLLKRFLDKQYFKNKKAQYKFKFLVQENEIKYVYNVSEFSKTLKEDESLIFTEYNKYIQEGLELYNVIFNKDNTYSIILLKPEKHQLNDNIFKQGVILQGSLLFNSIKCSSICIDFITNEYYLDCTIINLKKLEQFQIDFKNELTATNSILILSRFYKSLKYKLIENAILEFNHQEFNNLLQFYQILNCFSKQFVFKQYLKNTSLIRYYLESLTESDILNINYILKQFQLT